jgi:hypothetical protein
VESTLTSGLIKGGLRRCVSALFNNLEHVHLFKHAFMLN